MLIYLAWLMQLTVLNGFFFHGAVCSLPLTLTILWGFVFGSRLPPLTSDDLKVMTARQVFFRQLMSGSLSGFLVGAFTGALYASVAPVYPLSFPIVGWVAGYFCARKLQREVLLCIPVVLLATVFAEAIMAVELWFSGREESFLHLARIALPEAVVNAVIAPFCYFPMRRWHDFAGESSKDA